jgi:hypothetical protein
METEGSLSCSQKPTTGPYLEHNCCNNLFDNNWSEEKKFLARFEFLTVMIMKSTIFWNIMLCSLVEILLIFWSNVGKLLSKYKE